MKSPICNSTTMQKQHLLESLVLHSTSTNGHIEGDMSANESDEFGGQWNIIEEQRRKDDVECETIPNDIQMAVSKLKNCPEENKVPECNSSWGDFEGFSDSVANAESFSYSLEVLGNSSKLKHFQTVTNCNENHCATSSEQYDAGQPIDQDVETEDHSPVEDSTYYENVFKSSFPETPVQETTENIRTLEQLLATSDKENDVVKCLKTHLGMESWNTWRTVHDANGSPDLECPWKESRKNLLLALEIDSNEKKFKERLDQNSNGKNILKEPEKRIKVDDFNVGASKTLIQTKLSVTPDSKHGQYFTYQLYLKRAPSNGSMSAITLSGKKSFFATCNLKINS